MKQMQQFIVIWVSYNWPCVGVIGALFEKCHANRHGELISQLCFNLEVKCGYVSRIPEFGCGLT